MEGKSMKKLMSIACAGLCAMLLCGSTPIGFLTGETEPETTKAPETETEAPETEALETETEAPEPDTTKAPETVDFCVMTASGKKAADGETVYEKMILHVSDELVMTVRAEGSENLSYAWESASRSAKAAWLSSLPGETGADGKSSTARVPFASVVSSTDFADYDYKCTVRDGEKKAVVLFQIDRECGFTVETPLLTCVRISPEGEAVCEMKAKADLPVTYEWNYETLPGEVVMKENDNTRLTFYHAQAGKTITCKVSSGDDSYEATFLLVQSDLSVPLLSVPVLVSENAESVTLNSGATSSEKLSFAWYRYVPEEDTYTLVGTERKLTVQASAFTGLSDRTADMPAPYRCEVSNETDKLTVDFDIQIVKNAIRLDEITAKEGETVCMDPGVYAVTGTRADLNGMPVFIPGDAAGTIFWYQEGTSLPIAYGKDLFLEKVAQAQEGVYICKVAAPPYREDAPSYYSFAVRVEREMPFEDVTPDDWYYDAVLDVYKQGLMSGLSAVNFGVKEPLSRVQFVTVLYRMAGSPEAAYRDVFKDVPDGEWYTPCIMWASENGLVNGYGDGTFGVADPMTREQMMTFLYRYAQKEGADTSGRADLSAYSDGKGVSEFAAEAVSWAIAQGLYPNMGEGTLGAGQATTRADCAYVISMYKKMPAR